MTEFVELTLMHSINPILIPTHRIIQIAPNQDTGGCMILVDRGRVGGTTMFDVASPTYADLRQLLQPINAVA